MLKMKVIQNFVVINFYIILKIFWLFIYILKLREFAPFVDFISIENIENPIILEKFTFTSRSLLNGKMQKVNMKPYVYRK